MEDKVFGSLVKVAKSDIESAIILYNKGNYYNSMFLFQQAVEKGYKASALITKQLTLLDLKKVGHDYIKLLKKVVNEGFQGSKHPIDPIVYKIAAEDVELDTEDVHSTIGEAKRDEFFDLTEQDIEMFLNLISVQKTRLPDLFSLALGNPEFMTQVETYTNLTRDESDQGKAEFLNQSVEETKVFYQLLHHVFTLNILGILTSPHSEQARYPSYNTSDSTFACPSEIYNESMPLVKNQMKLMLLAQESINFLKS